MSLARTPPVVVAMTMATLLAGSACGATSDDALDETTPTITTAPTSATTTSPSALEPRPKLPPPVDGEAAACLPLCATGRVANRQIPAGIYQTWWFFGGLVTMDLDTPWKLWEDSTGEFSMGPIDDPDYRLVLWLDVYPVMAGARVDGVPSTADGLLGWLRTHPGLTVTEPIESAIGAMPATAVDVSISPAAVNDDPGCPEAVCQNFLGFPQWGEPFGIAGDDPYRLYFADVTYGDTDHVLVAAVEGRDPDHLAQFLPVAEATMATMEFPAHPTG